MKNKKLLSLALAALTMSSVVGCQKKADNILIWVGAESVEYYTQKLEEYKNANPDFEYGFDVKGVDTGSAASTFLNDTDAGADIFTIAHDNLAKLTAGSSTIMPVTDQGLLAQIEADNPDSFKSVIKSTVQGQEFTFAVPYISQALVLYYNTAVVSEEQAKTWEGLREAAKAASQPGHTVTAGTLVGTDGYNFSWSLLARKVSDNSTTLKLYENGVMSNCYAQGDDTIAVTKWTHDFFASENGAKFPSDSGWEVELKPKSGSNVGVTVSVVGGAWNYNAAKAALGNNLGVAKLPTFTITEDSAYNTIEAGTQFQSGTFADCKAFVMKKTSKYASVLQNIVKFLSSKEVQEGSYEVANNLPAYKNAATEFEAMNANTLEAKLARTQIEMSNYGIAQPFGVNALFNSFYYSKGAPDLYKALIEDKDGVFSTFEEIKLELANIESVWKTGTKIR